MVTLQRPRIWLTPPLLANLKAKAAQNDDRWLQCKQAADKPADWSNGLLNYALAYVVTGDALYAQKALSLLLPSAADGLNAITPDSGWQCRNALPAIAVCFDWLYPVLTPTQRATLVATMKLWGAWPWPETNPSRKGAWGVDDPDSNYYHGFLYSWMVGLSLFGEDPLAQTLIDVARSRFDKEVLPHLASLAQGGVFQETLGYGVGSTGFLIQNLLAHYTATGEELLVGNPWFTDAVTAQIQFTMPNLTDRAPFGDLSAGGLTDYNRRIMLCMSSRDRRCAPWLNAVTPNRNLQMLTRFEEALWYAPPIPGPTPPAEPLFYAAPGAGIVSSRTGWDPGATQLLAIAGPTLESHADRAQGAVMLWRNGWQLGTAKLGSHSGLDQEAWDYSCITVNGAKQSWTQAGCHWRTQEDTPFYTLLTADLAAAYPQLTAYTRELFFLKADSLLLIRDRYAPAAGVVAHFSVPVRPFLAAGAFQAGSLFGMPEGGLPISSQSVQNDPLDTVSWRVDVGGDATGEIRMVLEAGRPTQAARTFQPRAHGSATASGWAGWAWGVGPWTYTEPNSGPQYLIGVAPNTSYRISHGGLALSSAAGVLTWPGEGLPVTITEGGPPPPPPPPPAARRFTLTVPPTGAPSIVEILP